VHCLLCYNTNDEYFMRFESYLIKAVIPGHITYMAYVMANTVVLNKLEINYFIFEH